MAPACYVLVVVVVLQFSALGVGCAGAAVLLYEGIRVSEVVLRPLPRWASAPLGGALCGLIAFKFPQVCVQFCVHGYSWRQQQQGLPYGTNQRPCLTHGVVISTHNSSIAGGWRLNCGPPVTSQVDLG